VELSPETVGFGLTNGCSSKTEAWEIKRGFKETIEV